MNTATKSAGAAILASVVLQRLASGQPRASELGSEILAWTALHSLLRWAKDDHAATAALPKSSRGSPRPTDPSHASLLVIAVGLAGLGFCKAENGVLGLWSAITPFVLSAQRHPLTNPVYFPEAAWHSRPNVVNAVLVVILALFSNLSLARWDYLRFGISTVPVAVIVLMVHLSFMRRHPRDFSSSSRSDIDNASRVLTLKVVLSLLVALAVEAAIISILGFAWGEIIPTLVLGVAKASYWFFIVRTTRHASWLMAVAIGSLGIVSTLDPSQQPSESWALYNVMAACVALAQIIDMLPKQERLRHLLWVFALFPLVPYAANVMAAWDARSAAVRFSQHHTHPVESLILAARADFEKLLGRQSKSLKAAEEEYRRRYKMEPPPGFEAWYEYASVHESPLIDDFDTVYDSISPFWSLSGEEFKEAMSRLQRDPKLEMNLWHCRFSERSGETECSNPHRAFDRNYSFLFNKLLGGLRGLLPDVEFLVNHLDEPMVLIPPQASRDDGKPPRTSIHSRDMARSPTWDSITKSCSSQQRGFNGTEAKSSGHGNPLLPFVEDLSSGMDLCQHPEYGTMHGLFMSPTSFHLVEGLAPILSTGSPSTMGDVLFPSAAYVESEFQYEEASDMPWEDKRNKLYWAGSTTGGYAADDRWRSFQRQRFVSLTQHLEAGRQHHYLRADGGDEGAVHTIASSSFLDTRLFDVSITRVFQCDKRRCRDQEHYFRTGSWADRNEALRSRLVFDLDGNGISGRYYKLLASRSAPLKQTLLREWHDDRHVPWVHYVPVSMGMEELPELVMFLTSTEAGQQRAREIAEQGREWFGRAFREVDMGIYMYRLLLELARLQDVNRRRR